MKKVIYLKKNADGTVTAKFGTDRISFKIEEWMTDEDILDHAKWDFIALGVEIDHAEEQEVI